MPVDITSQFACLASELSARNSRWVLASLNDLLTTATREEVESLPVPAINDPYLANYVAAMVEVAAHRTAGYPPAWTSEVRPLDNPVFAVPWLSLRTHLLLNSPPPFARRNIFIDSTLGARV